MAEVAPVDRPAPASPPTVRRQRVSFRVEVLTDDRSEDAAERTRYEVQRSLRLLLGPEHVYVEHLADTLAVTPEQPWP